MTRPIVVGYDGSPASRAATRWAAAEAERRQLPLRVVHAPAWPIVHDPTGATVMLLLESIRAAAESLLDEACREIHPDHPGLRIDVAAAVGGAAPVLLREAAGASLLVLGSHGWGEFCDLAGGSVMSQLTTHARCPVVIVPAGWTEHGVPEIVVGVERSATSAAAIAFAFDQAEAVGAHLTAVLACHDPQRSGPSDKTPPVIFDVGALEEDGAGMLGESLAGQAATHPGVKLSEMLVYGPATNSLLEAARTAQLLVVGSAGREPFHGLLLGSAGQAVLHHATCPVAVVR